MCFVIYKSRKYLKPETPEPESEDDGDNSDNDNNSDGDSNNEDDEKENKKNSKKSKKKKKKEKPYIKTREISVITDLFQLEIISEVKCLTCDYCSQTTDICNDLSIEIPKPDSLDRTLNERKSAKPLPKRGLFGAVTDFIGITSQTIQN